jgi:hypothetical protein
MRTILIFIGCILVIKSTLGLTLVPSSHAAPPALSAGLPLQIPADWVEREALVPFTQEPDGAQAPLGVRILVNGKPVLDRSQLAELFEEDFQASLPKNTSILVTLNSDGKEVWHYPVGTRLAHRVRWNSPHKPIYELRIAERLASGAWALGVYAPSEPSAEVQPSTLQLSQYSGTQPLKVRFESAQTRKPLEVSLERIPLHSCRNCHNATSSSAYQFERPEDAGPCGFGPGNRAIRGAWAQRWAAQTGLPAFSR